MTKWFGLSLSCLILVLGFLLFKPDLRGWTPADPNDAATIVTPTNKGGRPFAVGECVPGSGILYGLPESADGAGDATMTVFSCRSKSSAVRILLFWLFLSLAYPLFRMLSRRRVR